MNTNSSMSATRRTPTATLIRDAGRKPISASDLLALKQELRTVRTQCLEASRKGDYLTQGRLTVQAARLNEAIALAEQIIP
jgi:hypothetical protein